MAVSPVDSFGALGCHVSDSLDALGGCACREEFVLTREVMFHIEKERLSHVKLFLRSILFKVLIDFLKISWLV
jgi:hypothetical protein